ncbi:MAG: LysM peptidoglycan-binding domain-containing protein [Paenisporosarcina sp.]
MNNDDYKHKIDEHRKPITLENESRSNSRVTRRSTKPNVDQPKPRRNLLLPILFTIFILIPVGFLIYIQVFYQPNQNETAIVKDSEFEYEENKQNLVDSEVADETDESNTDSSKEDEETEPIEPVAKDEDSENEVTQDEQEDTEESVEPETSEKSHVVQPNETLYRIAMNYYNSPDAVQKIKEANGLTSDSISTGQTLILP